MAERTARFLKHIPLEISVFHAVVLALFIVTAYSVVQAWIAFAIAASDDPIRVNRDFQVYYFAAKAFWSGQNPYDMQAVNLPMPRPAWLAFVYPAYAVYVFKPFILLDLETAQQVWLAIRLAVVALLVVGLRRLFNGYVPLYLLLPMLLLAFSGALFFDLWGGNIGTIEACLLTWALVWFDRDRPYLFVLLVLLAGAMKMLPLVFLAVPLLLRPWRQALPIAIAGGLGVLGLLFLAWLAGPDLFLQWLTSARLIDWLSRSFYSLAVQSLTFLDAGDPALIRRLSAVAHTLIAAAIFGATWLVLRRNRERPKALIYAVVMLALILCWPRLWRYAFVGVIGPILAIAMLDCRNGIWGMVRAATLIGLMLMLQPGGRAGVPLDLISVFKDLIATCLAWLNGLMMLQRKSGGALSAPPEVSSPRADSKGSSPAT